MRIHLVRHGQSEWNAIGRIQGQTWHVPLTSLGHRQAEAVASHLSGLHVDVLLTSDQVRAAQTAEVISVGCGAAVRPDSRLREQSYGGFEGRSQAELAELGDWRGAAALAGEGESLEDVTVRIGPLLAECLSAPGLSTGVEWPGEFVLVTHGDTIRAAARWLGRRYGVLLDERVPPNGSVTTVELSPDRYLVRHRLVTPSVHHHHVTG